MANSTQYPGVSGPPLHAPIAGPVVPHNLPPPPAIPQFHSVAHMQPSQQYISQPPHQYPPVHPSGSAVMPPQSLQSQYSQPIQPPVGPSIPTNHVPVALGAQVIHMPNVQPNMTMPSGAPPPPPSSLPGTQSYMTNPSNPGATHMASSYTFASSSYGQPQLNNNTGTQAQPMVLMNPPNNYTGVQSTISSENQTAVSVESNVQDPPAFASTLLPDTEQLKSANKSMWLGHTAADGRRYYYNKKTKRSTWEKPVELMTLIERADSTTNWKEYESPNGRKYYYNRVTKQSKWMIPEELKLARLQAEKTSFGEMQSEVASEVIPPAPSHSDSLSNPPSASITPDVSITPAVGSSVVSASDKDSLSQPEAVEAQAPDEPIMSLDKPALEADITRNTSNSASAEKAVQNEQNATKQESEEVDKKAEVAVSENVSSLEEKVIEPEHAIYASKQDARNTFSSLLESVNIESDWTWEQAMRVIINDKRYGALRTLGERKQAFAEFVSQRKNQEADKRRAKQRKTLEDFRTMLEECTKITSSTRWRRVISLLGDDERFKAVKHARDREDIFDEYVSQLEKKERALAAEEKKQYILEYKKFLQSCDFIDARTQWRNVQDRLEADERCARLDRIIRIQIFQEYVLDLEREEEEQKKIQKEEIRKTERRNRDEFRKLMGEHIAAGSLTAKTHWHDYCSKVKDSDAFLEVSSNGSGFTAKDLFEDVIEDLQKLYDEDKAMIKDALKSARVSVSSAWTLEDLKTAIDKDLSSSAISETTLKLVFDELLEKAKEKEEKQAKKLRRLGDDFFNLLCSLKDITASSSWEEVLPLFEHSEEYRSVGDKSFLRETFDQFITELKDKEKDRGWKRKEEKTRKEKGREKRSRDHKGKDRRHERDGSSSGRKERYDRDDSDDARELSESSEGRRGRENDNYKKHHKRYHEEEDDISGGRSGIEYSRSSHRHGSSRKKFRQDVEDSPGSDKEDRRKRPKRDHYNESHRHADFIELEDGEMDNWANHIIA